VKKEKKTMIDSAKDYLKFLTAGAFITVLLCAPIACTAHRDMKIAEMVQAGADPIAARCALAGFSESNNQTCTLSVIKGSNK
jgi:hypothetical protein